MSVGWSRDDMFLPGDCMRWAPGFGTDPGTWDTVPAPAPKVSLSRDITRLMTPERVAEVFSLPERFVTMGDLDRMANALIRVDGDVSRLDDRDRDTLWQMSRDASRYAVPDTGTRPWDRADG